MSHSDRPLRCSAVANSRVPVANGTCAENPRSVRARSAAPKTWRTSPSRYLGTLAVRRSRRHVPPRSRWPSPGPCEVRRTRCCRRRRREPARAARGRSRATSDTCTKSRSCPPSSNTDGARPAATALRKMLATPAYGVFAGHARPVHVVVPRARRPPSRAHDRTRHTGAPGAAWSRHRRSGGRAGAPRPPLPGAADRRSRGTSGPTGARQVRCGSVAGAAPTRAGRTGTRHRRTRPCCWQRRVGRGSPERGARRATSRCPCRCRAHRRGHRRSRRRVLHRGLVAHGVDPVHGGAAISRSARRPTGSPHVRRGSPGRIDARQGAAGRGRGPRDGPRALGRRRRNR